jgi:hypothetical protein
MAGLDSGREALAGVAQFGLTDKVSGAVSDYYDLLFDNVETFIGMNRGELKEYEAENSELREKLERGGMGDDERKTLLETMKKNEKMSSELRGLLDSDRIFEMGIEFSGEILDDNEPELTDRFKEAPVAEKYACLVAHYMGEYRAGLETRGDPGSGGGVTDASLVDIDSYRFGIEQARKFSPDIAKQHEERKREEYRELIASDPVKLHSVLMVEYSTAYVADLEKRLHEVQHDHDVFQSGLREHEATKPRWLKNLTTLGKAGKVWMDGREKLAREIVGNEDKMAELQRLREECKEGWLSETASEHAKGEIRSRNPEVVEACERHMARHWEKTNGERLEKQAARQNEQNNAVGKPLDDRSGFGRREWI